MERSGILAGGNWIVDKLKRIDVYPQQDALANILGESIGNGGSPFNILVDLAKLEAPFPLAGVGLVGDDEEGRWIAAKCDHHSINRSRLAIHPTAHTSYTDVMTVASTGRRTFFHQRGANAHLGADSFDFTATTARRFHLGYLLLLDALDQPDAEYGTAAARVLAKAREAGMQTSIDLVSEDSHRFSELVLPALPQVDCCILNEFELERTSGIPTRKSKEEGNAIDLAAVEAASCRLLEAGVREWVVVHFPEGATALGRDGHFHTQSSVIVQQEEILGTVGAGDAFAAGLLYGLHEGADIAQALRYGVSAAAACLRAEGASDGLAPLAEVMERAQQSGYHPALSS